MEKSQKLPKELYEIISGVLKFIEKSEADFVSDMTEKNAKDIKESFLSQENQLQ